MIVKICPRILKPISVAAIFFLSGIAAPAQQPITDSPSGGRARALNNSLLNLHAQMQQADVHNARTLQGQAAYLIAQRSAALATLIQQNPQEALTFAFSPELLADLAAKFPQSTSQLESHTVVAGPVQHMIADYPKGSRSWWTINTGQRSVMLYFAGPEPRELRSGETLQASGVLLGQRMAVETSRIVRNQTMTPGTASAQHPGGRNWPVYGFVAIVAFLALPSAGKRIGATRQTYRGFYASVLLLGATLLSAAGSFAQAPPCATAGPQSVAVLMVVYPGTTIPAYLSQQNIYAAYFNNPGGMSLSDYWWQASYQQTSVTGDVYGWFTLTYGASGYSSFDTLTQDAVNIAIGAGVPIQNYNRLSLVMPDWGGGWAGLAELSCASTYTLPTGGSITVSTSYINGTSWNNQNITQEQAINNAAMIAMHELGHNLGLNHSNSRAFTDASANPIPLSALGVQGTVQEYGDSFDAMSNGTPGHYDAPHKIEELNWIGPNNYAVVQSSGTWTVEPMETSLSATGLKALKIQRATNAWLWLEYRQPLGVYDLAYYRDPTYMSWADQFYSGALIHYEDSFTTGSYTHLLDFTPTSSYGFNDPSLAAGQSWTDAFTGLSISVQSATTSGLTVTVNYPTSTPTCTAGTPTIAFSPLDPSIYPGNSASYNLTVTNNDSASCPANTFTMGSSMPSGWPTSFSSGSVTISPGKSASVVLTKTGPAGTSQGTYQANANAVSGLNVGSATANITVMSPPALTVTVGVPNAAYTFRSSVPITATVLNGGTGATGANVSFTVMTPSGSTVTQSATTTTSGTAIWSYKLTSRATAGTYYVSAQASLSSGSRKALSTVNAVSNTASFSVQ